MNTYYCYILSPTTCNNTNKPGHGLDFLCRPRNNLLQCAVTFSRCLKKTKYALKGFIQKRILCHSIVTIFADISPKQMGWLVVGKVSFFLHKNGFQSILLSDRAKYKGWMETWWWYKLWLLVGAWCPPSFNQALTKRWKKKKRKSPTHERT